MGLGPAFDQATRSSVISASWENIVAGRKRKPKSAEAVEKTADAAVQAAAKGPAEVRKAAEEASATA